MTVATVLPERTKRLVFVAAMLGMLISALDSTIVSTALPTIVTDLGGAGHMSWVVTAYMVTEAISTVLCGKFGDLFSRKLVFQVGGIVFVVGSAMAGLATGMATLILARAIQGIGGGALMVTALALIADAIPLRERGKYQGAMGAVFGVATVAGPTLGGLFTDGLSWRWIFYVNVPIVAVMLFVTARYVPLVRSEGRPVIDYAGIALVASGVTALVLAVEWGGSEYAWTSPVILGLFVASVVLLALFVLVELRSPEPMLPMRLFGNPVFRVSALLSFIVGFVMLGAITYLPTYLQYVQGVSATASGLRTLPLVLGLLATSTLSGQVISRTGKYRIFPIAGSIAMAAGLAMLATMDADTGVMFQSLSMLVLGAGLGSTMQVLTTIVQNSVAYADLGTATSGVTFLRTLGGSFGATVFGALYSARLDPLLASALAQNTDVSSDAVTSAEGLQSLSSDAAAPFVDAYADSIAFVFQWVIPIALLGLLVALFLKQTPLREDGRADVADIGDGFAAPTDTDGDRLLERAAGRVLREHGEEGVQDVLARSGGTLSPGQAWALTEIHLWGEGDGATTLTTIARAHRMPAEIIEPVFAHLGHARLVALDGDAVALTPSGQAALDQVTAAWRSWLGEHLADWNFEDPQDRVLLDRAMEQIARRMLEEGRSPATALSNG